MQTKDKDKNLTESAGNTVWQIARTIGGLLLALIIIRFYVFQPFTISGSSMEPSFYDKEYIIVDEFSYVFGSPKRGDVVIFRHPEPACNEHTDSNYFNQIFFQGPCSNYIKRVVALPGETIVIKEGKVNIKNEENPNGLVLPEEYILDNIPTLGNQEVKLGKDEYFVLGDNRSPNASSDSREWGILPENHIIGKALVILLPPNRFGIVDSPEY